MNGLNIRGIEKPEISKEWMDPWEDQGEQPSFPIISTIESVFGEKEVTETKGEPQQKSIWFEPQLYSKTTTANLDDQLPATIYFLGRIVEYPEVKRVYVEELERGRRKHWTVLEERDYEVMEQIYDIEKDTKNRFASSDINFRITVLSEGGPSVSHSATKIYDSS